MRDAQKYLKIEWGCPKSNRFLSTRIRRNDMSVKEAHEIIDRVCRISKLQEVILPISILLFGLTVFGFLAHFSLVISGIQKPLF